MMAKSNEFGLSEDDAVEALQQVVDGFMFAGLLGTTHLATHTLDRIRSDPALYVPMYRADPEAFLLESARVDPPVTSVTAVLGEDKWIDVASGYRFTGTRRTKLSKGTTVQLTLSTANKDPKVFGGHANSKFHANRFDPLGRTKEVRI